MDDAPSSTSASRWRDWQWLVLLLILVLPLRAWLLWNTEVTARDSVGFIRIALQLEQKPWDQVVRSFQQHPGYPVAIWAVSIPVRAWTGETTPDVMRVCAQLVSALAALVLIVPMYYLGKALWDARIAFGAALLFQLLPMSGHHLSDGLSEALFVLMVACSLLGGVRGVQTGRLGWFLFCGAAGGLAYLTRPEGALVPAAIGLALLVMQFRGAWRQPWSNAVRQAAGLSTAALLVAGPYMWVIGGVTVKPSIRDVGANLVATSHRESTPRQPGLRAQLPAETFTHVTSLPRRLVLGAWALMREVGYALHYLGAIPALIALVRHGRSMVGRRDFLAPGLYVALHLCALMLLALSAGYISDRHLMTLVMLFCFLVMQGFMDLGGWLLARIVGLRTGIAPVGLTIPGVAFGMLALLVACGLPQTLKRVHGNRVGNHQAGLWLASQVKPGDIVLDDHAWSHFYSGLLFVEGREPALTPDAQPTCFVVMTRSNDPTVGAQRRSLEEKFQIHDKSRIVYHWPTTAHVDQARIVIHALPRNRQTHPWTVAN